MYIILNNWYQNHKFGFSHESKYNTSMKQNNTKEALSWINNFTDCRTGRYYTILL